VRSQGTRAVSTQTFNVSGLTCSSCESTLKDCLSSLPGIHRVSVSVVLSRAVVEGNLPPPEEIIRTAGQRTGFKLSVLEEEGRPSLFLRFRKGVDVDGLVGRWKTGETVRTGGAAEVVRRGRTVKVVYDARRISPREIYDSFSGSELHQPSSPHGRTIEILDCFPDHTTAASGHCFNTLGTRVLTSLLLTIPILILSYTGPTPPSVTSGSIQLVLVTVIMVYVVSPLYSRALGTLVKRREIEMDLLVVLSTGIAYGYSVVAFALEAAGAGGSTTSTTSTTTSGGSSSSSDGGGGGTSSVQSGTADSGMGPIWETPALLVTLIMLGRWLVWRARERAVRDVKRCSELNVRTARVLMKRTGTASLPSRSQIQGLPTETDMETEREMFREVDVRLLGYDDILLVQPGEVIPSDGILLPPPPQSSPQGSTASTTGSSSCGGTEVSEAMFTGESTPQAKHPGSTLLAGSINLLSPVHMRVTKLSSENTLSGIQSLITSSQLTKPHIQSYTDRIAGFIGPLALLCALLAFTVWFLVNKLVRGETVGSAATDGLMYAIAVLAVTCPCTIGLAVPMNVVVAGGVAARMGVVVKDQGVLEVLHRVRRVVFDKTGTVTRGEMAVVEEYLTTSTSTTASSTTITTATTACGESTTTESTTRERREIREMVLRLVAGQKHPVAKAVERYLLQTSAGHEEPQDPTEKHPEDKPHDNNVQVIIGQGLELKTPQGLLRGGSHSFLHLPPELSAPTSDQLQLPQGPPSDNLSSFSVTLNDNLLATYSLRDHLRPEAKAVVHALHKRAIEVFLVSGDRKQVTEQCARDLGIPLGRVYAGVLPAEKAGIIRDLQSAAFPFPTLRSGDSSRTATGSSTTRTPVVFVGDGLNDTPALAASDIPISFIHAADLTLSSSSVLLLNPHLTSILELHTLSRRVYRRIWITFAWAAMYNLGAILMAAGAVVVWRIEARWAGVGEVVSVLPVVVVGWSLRWKTRW